MFFIVVAPWFEHKDEKTVMKKTGESVILKCSAKGFPLNVEWKFKSNEMVESCIGKFEVSKTEKGATLMGPSSTN